MWVPQLSLGACSDSLKSQLLSGRRVHCERAHSWTPRQRSGLRRRRRRLQHVQSPRAKDWVITDVLSAFLIEKSGVRASLWGILFAAHVPNRAPPDMLARLQAMAPVKRGDAEDRESQNASPIHSIAPEGTMGSPLGSMPNLPTLTDALLSEGEGVQSVPAKAPRRRIALLDNAKAALIYCVVLYHIAVVYSGADRPESPVAYASGLLMLLKPVVMPGFCLISGHVSRATLLPKHTRGLYQLVATYVLFQTLLYLNDMWCLALTLSLALALSPSLTLTLTLTLTLSLTRCARSRGSTRP